MRRFASACKWKKDFLIRFIELERGAIQWRKWGSGGRGTKKYVRRDDMVQEVGGCEPPVSHHCLPLSPPPWICTNQRQINNWITFAPQWYKTCRHNYKQCLLLEDSWVLIKWKTRYVSSPIWGEWLFCTEHHYFYMHNMPHCFLLNEWK